MMTARTGERDLPDWLKLVEADDQPELHTFAAGIRHDLAAVTAGLTLPYSSGSKTHGLPGADLLLLRGAGALSAAIRHGARAVRHE